MTDKEKQTLLIDLCARLPYGVKCLVSFKDGTKHVMTLKTGLPNSFGNWDFYNERYSACSDDFKPYLRPMSSMTEEELKEYHNLCFEEEREQIEFGEWITRVYYHNTVESIDWLNAHHFDYRGLIDRGLALEAPEGMYNINKK